MGKRVNILAFIEGDSQPELLRYVLERYDPDFHVDLAATILAVQEHIHSNTYDCMMSTHESPHLGAVRRLQITSRSPEIPLLLLHQRELDSLHIGTDITKHACELRRLVEKRGQIKDNRPQPRTHPLVSIREGDIYVEGADGKDILWGYEGIDPYSVASSMELELRAIDYVRDRLAVTVSEVTEELNQAELPIEDVPDLVFEGYRKLLLWFRDLDESFGCRLR